MTKRDKNNITFHNPPIVETVLGVQFNPLPKLTNGHLGLFWKSLGRGWPHADDALIVPLQSENFEEHRSWGEGASLQVSFPSAATRLRIFNEGRHRMIQVQNGRLHYNWLKRGEVEYPRYPVVLREFEKTWRDLVRFFNDNQLGEVVPNQWEITYVDHIPKGTVWETPSDWAELFRAIPLGIPQSELKLETIHVKMSFEIPDKMGRLHLSIQKGSHEDQKSRERRDLIRLGLTARGPINDVQSLEAGFHKGHAVLVDSFEKLTSPKAHKVWRKK
jgi:uncharacterized protein (TIGR04255 family)